MNTTGALFLFAGLGILLIVGMSALDSLHSEVNTTDDSELEAQNEAVKSIENPIFMTFGYGLLIVVAIAAVKSFGDM